MVSSSNSTSPNVQGNIEQILSDITTLQQQEQSLLHSLETNSNLTTLEQKKIIDNLNQISNMRINLYETAGNINGFFQNSLTSSVGVLEEQVVAIGIVENELIHSKKRLELLEYERNNKIRLVEINNYYGEKYSDHSKIMKIVIFTLIPVIILAILNKKGILPNTIYYALIIIISAIGGYYFWIRLASIISRDNMNYQEYDWYFDSSTAPGIPSVSSTKSDPWANNSASAICVGQNCCAPGQTWIQSLNKCRINIGSGPVIAPVTSSTVNTKTATISPSSFPAPVPVARPAPVPVARPAPVPVARPQNISSILTKQEPGKFKTDYNMGTIQPNVSSSFFNGKKF